MYFCNRRVISMGWGGPRFIYKRLAVLTVARLRCNDYGFECDFVAQGGVEEVIDNFKAHTEEEHGIDYSREALMQFIARQQG